MGTIAQSFHSETALIPARWTAMGRSVVAAAGRLFAAWTNYRGLAALSRMDDRGLADIGLSRSDVKDALAQRWWEDPTVALNERRGARRAARARDVVGDAPPLAPEPGFTRPPTDRPSRLTV